MNAICYIVLAVYVIALLGLLFGFLTLPTAVVITLVALAVDKLVHLLTPSP